MAPECKSKARLDGKTAVVTGCNTGIGKETVRDFVIRGCRVIMACRDVGKAEDAAKEIRTETAGVAGVGVIVVVRLDLSSFASVRQCAAQLLHTEPAINLLINNAGVAFCPKTITIDGFEMQFATNHLGHFLFTLLLLPRILKSTPARIVNVSSLLHTVGKLNFDDINMDKKYSPTGAYNNSKLANVLFSRELANRLEGTGVTTYSLHPGAVDTDAGRHYDTAFFKGSHWILKNILSIGIRTPKQGAQTTIYCAVDENVGQQSGLYYSDCKKTKASSRGRDARLAVQLWEESLKMVSLEHYDPFSSEALTEALAIAEATTPYPLAGASLAQSGTGAMSTAVPVQPVQVQLERALSGTLHVEPEQMKPVEPEEVKAVRVQLEPALSGTLYVEPEQVKPEQMKPVEPEEVKAVRVQLEPALLGTLHVEPEKVKPVEPEEVKAVRVQLEPALSGTLHVEPEQVKPLEPEEVKAVRVQLEPALSGTLYVEPEQVKPVEPEEVKAVRVQLEPALSGTLHVEPEQVKPVEPVHVKPVLEREEVDPVLRETDTADVEPSHVLPVYVQPLKDNPIKPEPANVESVDKAHSKQGSAKVTDTLTAESHQDSAKPQETAKVEVKSVNATVKDSKVELIKVEPVKKEVPDPDKVENLNEVSEVVEPVKVAPVNIQETTEFKHFKTNSPDIHVNIVAQI